MESEEMITMREAHQKFREYIDLQLLNALDEIQQRTVNLPFIIWIVEKYTVNECVCKKIQKKLNLP